MITSARALLSFVLCISLITGVAAASASASASESPTVKVVHPWLAAASAPIRQAILEHLDKTPPEFFERLDHALPDGSLVVMVRLRSRSAQAEALARSATHDLRWYGDLPAFYGLVHQEGLAQLLASPKVLHVEPDYRVTNFLSTAAVDVSARSAEDPTGLWAFDSGTGPYGALTSEIAGFGPDRVTGKGIVVADTDSGIDGTHRDFGGWDCEAAAFQPCESRIVRKVIINQALQGDNDEAPLPTTDLASGHGTHTAGIIAGNGFYARAGESQPSLYGGDGYTFGIAPQASLISVKLGDSQSAALGYAGLQWQAAHARRYDIRVSNNSWGCANGCSFDDRSATALVLKNLYDEGVLVTFAAGNNGGGGDGAAYNGAAQSPYVLGVGAYDDEQEVPKMADFSSRGLEGEALPDPESWRPSSESQGFRRPDLSAPGVFIYSAANLTGGTSSLIPRVDPQDAGAQPGVLAYTPMSGTSMSTPMVSGAAALLFGACPSASTLDVMRALMVGASGRTVQDSDGTTTAAPHVTGYGALDVRASFEWLDDIGVCPRGESGEVLKPVIEAPSDATVGKKVVFDASKSTVSTGSIARHEWDFGDGRTAAGQSVTHTYKRPGFYEVILTVHGPSGASRTRRQMVSVSKDELFVDSAVVRGGSYLATNAEFIFSCPRKPQSQDLDGHVFTLPERLLGRGPFVAVLSASSVDGNGIETFASVFTEGCQSTTIAYTEGRSRVAVDVLPNTRFVVASIDAPLSRDIKIDLKVHSKIRSR